MAVNSINKFMPFLGLNQAVNPVKQKQAEPTAQPLQQFQQMAPVSNDNPYGISIAGQVGYVKGVNGEDISIGQDGVGLAYMDKWEYKYWIG